VKPRRAIAATATLALLYACSAEDLVFEGVAVTPAPPSCIASPLPWFDAGPGGYAWSPYDDTNGNVPIDDLSYGALYQLCVWMNQGGNPCSAPAVAPGYATGQFSSCTSPSGAGTHLTRVWLGLTECVENLQHSACGALVGDLTACVLYFGEHADNPDCTDAMTICGPYEAVPGCNETVLQANPQTNTSDPVTSSCAESLPIVAGVECPPATASEPTGDDGSAGDAQSE
jgi:hypothetical protein